MRSPGSGSLRVENCPDNRTLGHSSSLQVIIIRDESLQGVDIDGIPGEDIVFYGMFALLCADSK